MPRRITDMRAKILVLTIILAATAFAKDDFPYVFKRGSGSIIRIYGSIESYTRYAKRFSGDYIWARRDGHQYLIRDEAVLAEAEAAFADMRALEPQMRAAEERLRPLEEKADALSDDESADHEEELEALESQLEAASREVDRLEEEMDRREQRAEKKFEQIVIKAIAAGKAQRVD